LTDLYSDALMRLLDSRVVAGFARLIGLPAPTVVTGSDLTSLLLRAHVRPDEPVTIVGLAPALLPALGACYGLANLAHCNPPPGFDRDPAAFADAVGFVLAHPARFTFLAVGSPRQEKLAAAIQATGQARGIGLCIGASLEFLAGARRRAPAWMQRAGLEWLHRLAHDPHRLARRYLLDSPAVLPMLLRARFGARVDQRAKPPPSVPALSRGRIDDAWHRSQPRDGRSDPRVAKVDPSKHGARGRA
jgi:N-acetylglucosaminyldiphosphoundecaprenol N-acetyl-beta-D-mannosaminyltransferase